MTNCGTSRASISGKTGQKVSEVPSISDRSEPRGRPSGNTERPESVLNNVKKATDSKDYPFLPMSLILNWSFQKIWAALTPRAANELHRI